MSILVAEGFDRWRECRAAYDELLHSQYQLAEDRTNGAMLNERGRQAGIDPRRLFTSNATYRAAYASEELIDHWRDYPHVTFAAYEAQWPPREDPHEDEDEGYWE